MNNPFMPVDLDKRWENMSQAGPNLQSRELFRFVLNATENQTHVQEVEQALIWAEAFQDRDPNSETYGNFRWYRKNEKPMDRNAVEFAMEVGVLVWIHHREKLSGESQARLKELMEFSVEGIRRHTPAVSYTNIYTMKMWNCIGIGENLPNQELAEEGYAMVDTWMAEISQNGLHEYVSPTYSPVSMECIENIAQHTTQDQVREKINRALKLCWLQLGANWLPTCERLVGAHSRDYDYLGTGVRNLRVRNRMASLLNPKDKNETPAYVPTPYMQDDVKKMLNNVPRIVCQKWGAKPYETATTYVGQQFAIGSAGAAYGPIDKCLTVHLRDKETPNISFFCDARGDHYGQRQFELKDGHSKALHLVPFLTSVQKGPEVLFLAAPEPKGRHYHRSAPNPTCLLSHLILPNNGTVSISTEQLDNQTIISQKVPNGTPIFLQYDNVNIGIRFVVATQTNGEEANVMFERDQEGQDYGAMRITCTHDTTAPTTRGIAAIWIGIQENASPDEYVAFQKHFSQEVTVSTTEQTLTASVPGWHSEMSLSVDLENQAPLALIGGETNINTALFAVNTQEIGRNILSE
ncbi:MAG: hypothetical protein HN521_04200 [Candidatus Latescibacteria bacterium]|nr:hypothetical protein [Candidatus Latescibacterota bacterium]MBT5832525.1 hypothetical protein [Candidatus Latescibacterota bacterium]